MVSRRTLLALSVVCSIAVHGGLLALAPWVSFHEWRTLPTTMRHYHVQLRKEPVPPPAPAQPPRQPKNLATKPGSVEDLIKGEREALAPPEALLRTGTGIPQLSSRVASEIVPREHNLGPDTGVLAKVDAKIIEIAQDTARMDLDIPRRIVSPSPDRILGENEFPTLRAPSDETNEPIGLGGLPAPASLLGEPAHAPGETVAAEKPPYEEHVLLPEPAKLPPLPEVEEIARAPVVKQIREENPYEFMDDFVDVKLDRYVPPGENQGFFRLQIVPKKGENVSVLPKDVTFVIDASQSIVQRKLDGTAKGVKDMVSTLRPEDRFNIVVFRDTASSFQPTLAPATPENKAAALSFLTNLESRGGTNVYNALRPVIETPPRPGVPGIVVVASDGRPTAGVRDPRTIINDLTAENTLGNSVFAYGGGNTVNTYLLDLLAYRNRGEARVLPSFDTINKDLPNFFSQLSDPILAGLNADYGHIDKTGIFPKAVPDFYKGRAVTVFGRFDPARDKEFSMRLTGSAESKRKEVIFKADLSKAAKGDEQIARNWAFQKIYYLIGEVCRVGETPELLNEIQQLSTKYHIRTSYSE